MNAWADILSRTLRRLLMAPPEPTGLTVAQIGFIADLAALGTPHRRFPGSIPWSLNREGLWVDGAPARTRGAPETVTRCLEWFGDDLALACAEFKVPLELAVACACAESVGGARSLDDARCAQRREPGYVSDDATPHRVSIGFMQTLISTARSVLDDRYLRPNALRDPRVSARAGVSYMARQRPKTGFDPPLVGAAYNAGDVYEDKSAGNRWRARCYPIGTGEHVDRFVAFFGDAFFVLARDPGLAGRAPSFAAALGAKVA